MRTRFRVIQVGLGAMGRRIARLLIERENIDLIGVVDINPDLKDKKLNEILDLPNVSEIKIESNLYELLNRKQVDVVIILTSSSLEKVASLIMGAVKAGSNVISICEELSYPFEYFPKLSNEIDELAKANEVSVVGTGINPGYLMDLLPIVLTAPCQTVQKISIIRMMNSAKRRIPFQEKIGTGLSIEEFRQKIDDKEITGHVGLTQSIQMIMSALGMTSDEIIEFPPGAIIAEKDITTSYCTIPKGFVCGLQSKAVAKKGEVNQIILDFTAYAGEHEEFDSIYIEGTPRISQKIEGGVHGDKGTVAMVVNLIPRILVANPGLLTMKDLPVPCNTEGIWKETDSL
ncbi:MAG: NAD(P)H-dependent amine dehydrogenase family protein [Candidatus Hodarchaeales archaeon]|jgi:4-hydroxy-tetrahydrodipicolinate reductase